MVNARVLYVFFRHCLYELVLVVIKAADCEVKVRLANSILGILLRYPYSSIYYEGLSHLRIVSWLVDCDV